MRDRDGEVVVGGYGDETFEEIDDVVSMLAGGDFVDIDFDRDVVSFDEDGLVGDEV